MFLSFVYISMCVVVESQGTSTGRKTSWSFYNLSFKKFQVNFLKPELKEFLQLPIFPKLLNWSVNPPIKQNLSVAQ